MIHLIADYKDQRGQYFHSVFQACGTDNPKEALSAVLRAICSNGYSPCAVALIPGTYTLPELEYIADRGSAPEGSHFLFLNKAECLEVCRIPYLCGRIPQ